MSDGGLIIAAAEAREAAKDGVDLKDKVTRAMKATYKHWMVTNEDNQFRAAMAGVMAVIDGEDMDSLQSELNSIRALNAALSGVPVSFEMLDEIKNPVGIMNIWNEIKE